MAELVMPRLSDTMEEGTILRWLKSDGDDVRRGDELVEIETDKANMIYQSDLDGALQTVAAEGDTLPVGALIAHIGVAGDGAAAGGGAAAAERSAGDRPDASPAADAPPAETPSAETLVESIAEVGAPTTESLVGGAASDVPAGDGRRVKASPLARRIARDRGVDLHALSGSGPGGRIVKADVEGAGAADASRGPAPSPGPRRRRLRASTT